MKMKSKLALVSVVVFLAGLGAALAQSVPADAAAAAPAAPAVVKQTTCPVMEGSPINSNIYADANGKRVYFCCHVCQSEFKANPEKYIEKLEKQGVTLEKTPAAPAAVPAP